MKLLVCVSGSVATIKLPLLIQELKDRATALSLPLEIKVACSTAAMHFVDNSGISERIYLDNEEWGWKVLGDPILHIDLMKWADACVYAPLSANSLAKLANGLCDNLITSIARAWDFIKPIYIAPAMNTNMWNHPITKMHLATLSSLGYVTIYPVIKLLACGDEGMGAMAHVKDIAAALLPN